MSIKVPPLKTSPTPKFRLQIDNLLEPSTSASTALTDGQDAIAGLTQSPKSLPPKYFYDQRGSELFEQICELPEYYLTRTETDIFHAYADKIVQITGPCELVELGSGSATKTRILLEAYQAHNLPLRYLPIDVSGTMLEASSHQLLADYPGLTIQGIVSTYEPALTHLPPTLLPTRMIGFIGSTLGNLMPQECHQFLAEVSTALQPGQYFLLGLDLHKETALLEAAYNDSQGITAAFNLNMLSHLNWRFDGDFNLEQFTHVAFYNEAQHQIEIYLESRINQTVHLDQLKLAVNFAKGERLLSEISRKFDLAEITKDLASHHLRVVEIFTDQNRWFGLILCQKS